jgi:hypothetical protein
MNNIMQTVGHAINKVLGYNARAQQVHDQKNRFTHEMIELQNRSRQLAKKTVQLKVGIEHSTAYKVAQATGRLR